MCLFVGGLCCIVWVVCNSDFLFCLEILGFGLCLLVAALGLCLGLLALIVCVVDVVPLGCLCLLSWLVVALRIVVLRYLGFGVGVLV